MSKCYSRIRFGWALSSLLVLAFAGTSFAAITGKLSGTVTDSEGIPLPGAAVTVEATRLGATTDADGQYVILQVPPGTHSVTAQLIGYNATTVTDVRVNADLTSRVNFRLVEEAIEVGAITVTAERPPIEVDVTGSQTIVDAARVAEMPVNQMLDVLNYQPGVNVVRDNELEIRGGGPSQIRFQVDGVDRTDGITGKGVTQLNQMLVSEVTLLTGGFNAEYGNVRSGMVNVVVKDGSERGSLKPWLAGVVSYAPTQQKHFGENGYSENQYSYWLTQINLDSAYTRDNPGGVMLWPDLYESTRNDAAFMALVDSLPTRYTVSWQGWNSAVKTRNGVKRLRDAYAGYRDWTAEDMAEYWAWETNMNEQVWAYGDKPDLQTDLAVGFGLPNKLGGVVLGYSYNKEMTAVPALRPYTLNQSFESKLTLTPVDNLKMSFSYVTATDKSTGGATSSLMTTSESNTQNAGVGAGDPVSLRSTSDLIQALNGNDSGADSRTNLSYSGRLNGTFDQISASMTYTLNANTYINASFGTNKTTWELERDLPRADSSTDTETNWHDSTATIYNPGLGWNYSALLNKIYTYDEYPTSLDYATNPDNYTTNTDRTPFGAPNAYEAPPAETKFVTKTFSFAGGDVVAVSPQGWVESKYSDVAKVFIMGGGSEANQKMEGSQSNLRGDITHVRGSHTLKAGLEYTGRDVSYLQENSSFYEADFASNSEIRAYGYDYPAAQPKIMGLYAQDKYESDGMIANLGVRVERFDAGHPSWFYDDMWTTDYFTNNGSLELTRELYIAAGWDTTAWGQPTDYASSFWAYNDSLNGNAPTPADVVRAWPGVDNKIYWRASPRFGISHPVSLKTKFFFNYGVFYQVQQAQYLYGFRTHDGLPGGNSARINTMYNANLRPSSTTMYEVGVEHVLPAGAVFKVTGYAKYNEDQVTAISVQLSQAGSGSYTTYRNGNYQDIRGYELQLSRNSGRFLNGALSYEASSTRTGEVQLTKISDDRALWTDPFLPNVRTTPARGFFRAFVSLGTPMDWGVWSGGWSLGTEYTWQKGDEELYNPNQLAVREIPDENYMPWVNESDVNMKLQKRFRLPGGRYLSAYMDVTNVLNTKHLNKTGVSDWGAYTEYIFKLRSLGQDVKVGDESTFNVFTEPYKTNPDDVSWKQPISPTTDWLLFMNPRFYRFGVRFEL